MEDSISPLAKGLSRPREVQRPLGIARLFLFLSLNFARTLCMASNVMTTTVRRSESKAAPASRASWCGQLRIGDLCVPVKAYSAIATPPETPLRQLHAGCGQRIEYRKWCPKHGVVSQGGRAANPMRATARLRLVRSRWSLHIVERLTIFAFHRTGLSKAIPTSRISTSSSLSASWINSIRLTTRRSTWNTSSNWNQRQQSAPRIDRTLASVTSCPISWSR